MSAIQVGDHVTGPAGAGVVLSISNGLRPSGMRLQAVIDVDGTEVVAWLDELSRA